MWLSVVTKDRMPRGVLFETTSYVVQITRDIASVSLQTCTHPAAHNHELFLSIMQEENKSPVQIRKRDKLVFWFVLYEIQAT